MANALVATPFSTHTTSCTWPNRPCSDHAAHRQVPQGVWPVRQRGPVRTWAVAGGVRCRCLCNPGPLLLQRGSPQPRFSQNRRPAQQLRLLPLVPQHRAERRASAGSLRRGAHSERSPCPIKWVSEPASFHNMPAPLPVAMFDPCAAVEHADPVRTPFACSHSAHG